MALRTVWLCGLRRAKSGIDAEAKGRCQPCRQALRRQALPILHGPLVFVLPISLQAAQQQFPFEKRRTQTDALQRFTRRLVLAGFGLRERKNDTIKIGLQGRRQRGAASGFLLHTCIDDISQDTLCAGRIGQLLDKRQRPFDLAA